MDPEATPFSADDQTIPDVDVDVGDIAYFGYDNKYADESFVIYS